MIVAGAPPVPSAATMRPKETGSKNEACGLYDCLGKLSPFRLDLAESFLKRHPDDEFHLLLVDRLPQDFTSRDPRVQVLEVEKLGLPAFRSLAFKFDILELNTGVKPSFLKYLFALGADKVIYFDPDIYVFHSVIPPVFLEPALPGKSSRNQYPAVDYFYRRKAPFKVQAALYGLFLLRRSYSRTPRKPHEYSLNPTSEQIPWTTGLQIPTESAQAWQSSTRS